jgi:hypothetical protein
VIVAVIVGYLLAGFGVGWIARDLFERRSPPQPIAVPPPKIAVVPFTPPDPAPSPPPHPFAEGTPYDPASDGGGYDAEAGQVSRMVEHLSALYQAEGATLPPPDILRSHASALLRGESVEL